MKAAGAIPKCIACSTRMRLRFGEKVPAHWRCPSCGLECIWPQPDDETLAPIYDASYFAHYRNSSDPEIVRTMKRATYRRQLVWLNESKGNRGRLLDCGAATGFLCELAKELAWEPFAIEISEFGAQACAKLLGAERVHRGELQQARFAANPEGLFAAITMFDFIEHVRDPLDVLKWARSKLTDNGALLLTTPRTGTISWLLMGRQWFHYTAREHLWFFSREAIKRLLKTSGFRSMEVKALPKAVTIGYALGHYGRDTTYSKVFSPAARFCSAILGEGAKRQRLWFHLGEMAVLARP